MEGIMNLPAGVGGATSQDGLDSFAPLIAAQQTARDMGYPRFTRELLAAGSELDAAEVQEFLQAIRDAGLTSEDVALMRRVVEAVFGDPNNYPEVRGRLLAEGVPEDLLPETFDLEFFTALRMAVEEAENLAQEPRPMDQGMAMEAPVGMAEGGIVGLPQLTPVARELASMGRNGDTMLAHITPQEAMMLKRMGGSGTINPYTGLPEFFLKSIGKAVSGVVKGVGKAISSVGKAVKKFAKSTVGRAVTSIALGAFLGPAAAGFLGVSSAAGVAAVSGALGGFGSSILAGDGIQNALRSGLTGAVLAGGITGITGGAQAFAARPEFAQAYQQQGFLGTIKQTAKNYFGSPVETAKQMYGAPEAVSPDAVSPASPVGTATDLSRVTPPTDAISAQTANAPFLADKAVDPTTLNYADQAFGATTEAAAPITRGMPVSSQAANAQFLVNKAVDPTTLNYADQLAGTQFNYPGSGSLPGIAPSSITGTDLTVTGAAPGAGAGAERGFFGKTMDFFSPGAREAAGQQAATAEYSRVLADTGSETLAEEAYRAAMPGTLSKYGPILAAGGATLAATGSMGKMFEPPEQEPGETYEQYAARRQAYVDEWSKQNPEFFGSFAQAPTAPTQATSTAPMQQPVYFAAEGSGPEGVKSAAGRLFRDSDPERSGIFSNNLSRLMLAAEEEPRAIPFSRPSLQPNSSSEGQGLFNTLAFARFLKGQEREEVQPESYADRQRRLISELRLKSPELFGTLTPVGYAQGTGPQGVENFPRKTGHISGPGTGTSDDIPAMLSDGEFVFTAKAVRNMGNGSRRRGAARMYRMMKMLEGGPVNKTAKA